MNKAIDIEGHGLFTERPQEAGYCRDRDLPGDGAM
jgi:hypothetical protein